MSFRNVRPPSDADQALRRRTEAIGAELQAALLVLLGTIEGAGARDQKAYQSFLQIGQSAVSRLLSAVRAGDPLTTMVAIPGKVVLAQVLQGASRSGIDAACLARATQAVKAFEAFVDVEFGDRAALDVVLSEWVLESQAAFDLRHRSIAYKSAAALRGVQADLVLSVGIVYPSPDSPDRHDGVGIDALLGCRRLKPSGLLRLNFSSMAKDPARYAPQSLSGKTITEAQDLLVPEFSTVQASQISGVRQGQLIQTSVSDLPLGRAQGRGHDMVHAHFYKAMHRARRGEGRPTSGMAAHAEPPTEYAVIDALLHDDVWPGIQPEVRIFDTVIRGLAHPDDPARVGDRLDTVETVQLLGQGPDAFRLPEFNAYPDLIRHVCQARGWDAGRLRGYRIKVRYPTYGSQIGLAFQLPI
jgi:hypothetical protein